MGVTEVPLMDGLGGDRVSEPYPAMPADLVERYLRLLGVQRKAPSLEELRELVRAHLFRVPFENVSKLYYRKHLGLMTLPNFEVFLEGIEGFNFGGTCYPNNYYFYQLLSDLGYRAILCGADMSNPDVHLVSMVEVDGRQYLMDVGYAAPFATPLPRDGVKDFVIRSGRDRYVLEPQDAAGRSRLQLYRDGALKHGYVAKPEPRQIVEFETAIADSFRDEATFMNALLLARFFPDRSLVIHNLTVIESRGTAYSLRVIADRAELVRVISRRFGIPASLTRDVVSELGALGDAWH